jgi:hypothetical protein
VELVSGAEASSGLSLPPPQAASNAVTVKDSAKEEGVRNCRFMAMPFW